MTARAEIDTIYALASGRGRAGVAVIRVSGPGAKAAAARMGMVDPPARRATRIDIVDPKGGEILDEGLGIWFPAPGSFTGEDVAELHGHGGPAVIAGILEALGAMPGLRMAEPGEFTRRAFENGKMDLTAAEAIADLVDAETAAQRRQALRQGGGALAALCDAWRDRLVATIAHWEAAIDFSDEDLPADLEARTVDEAAALADEIGAHLADGGWGERLRDGLQLAIVGPPNAGKSSLLNALAKRDVAIVSETAGTTRDVIEVHLDLGGYPVIAADTAGIRITSDSIELEGVRRARSRAEAADLRILVLDAGAWPEALEAFIALLDARTIVALNKSDIHDVRAPETAGESPVFAVSARTGDGLGRLLQAVEGAAVTAFDEAGAPVVTRARHREALGACVEALRGFLDRGDRLANPEIGAEDLRLAARAVGRVTGRVDVEDLLDVIFADFCIGK